MIPYFHSQKERGNENVSPYDFKFAANDNGDRYLVATL